MGVDRRALWRACIGAMLRQGWMPALQEFGGKCVVTRFHVTGGLSGAFLCRSCGRVVLRGEGRWWE